MNQIRFCFPNFILLASIFALFFSCQKEKNQKDIPNTIFYKNIELAEQNLKNSNYQKAFRYYFVAKESCSKEENDRKVYALNEMAEIQRKQSDFSGYEATSTDALKICQNPIYLQRIYNAFGLSYLEQNDFQNSLKSYILSLKNCSNINDKLIIKNNIGYLFIKSQQYQKAIDTLQYLIKNDFVKNDQQNYARALDNLGYAFFKTKNPKAIDYINQSLKIRETLKEDYSKIASYIHLSEYYQNTNRLLANDYARKAYTTANKINSPDDRLEALKFLIQNSNPIEAKKLAIIQMNLSDSIKKVRKSARNEFAKIKYDSKKANKNAAKYKRQIEILFFILLIITTFSILIYYLIQSKNKNKLIQNTYLTETRIAKKLHDELANDVHNTIAFAETQNLNEKLNKETLLDNLEIIYNRARNISNENKDIDTGEKFIEKLKAMITTYNSNEINVIINFDFFNSLKCNKEIKIVIFRIIQELLVNMKKHSQCSLASISIKNEKKSILINYSDNGIGVEMLNLKSGLQNMENRIQSIKGTVKFDTLKHKGFKAKIILPR